MSGGGEGVGAFASGEGSDVANDAGPSEVRYTLVISPPVAGWSLQRCARSRLDVALSRLRTLDYLASDVAVAPQVTSAVPQSPDLLTVRGLRAAPSRQSDPASQSPR